MTDGAAVILWFTVFSAVLKYAMIAIASVAVLITITWLVGGHGESESD